MEDHLLYITSLYAFFILENMVSRRNFEVDQEELCWDAFMHNSFSVPMIFDRGTQGIANLLLLLSEKDLKSL